MTFRHYFTTLLFITTVTLSSLASAKVSDSNKLIRMATTTSTENSGLLKYLLPKFERETGYKTHVIAVGTGKALRMGRDGDVDLVLVHALNAEKKFVEEGSGVKRFPVMYNDFVLVGPQGDSKDFKELKTTEEVLQKIAREEKRFVSRGDDSGTHKKEQGLWKSAGEVPSGKQNRWYIEAGQGMGKVLQMTGEMQAYTMTDRGTWLAYLGNLPLEIIFEGDPQLFNPYGIIAVNPKKYPDVNNNGANALIEWITSDMGQHLIGEFKIADQNLFTPSAITMAKTEDTK